MEMACLQETGFMFWIMLTIDVVFHNGKIGETYNIEALTNGQ